jgi:exodeoxyribonuclease V gamma subunit
LDNLILSGDEFPEGVWGEGARTRMRRKLLAWSERVAAQWAGRRPETVAKRWEIPLHGDTWVFSGEVGDCWVDQRIVACWETPRSRDWIGLWLQHLFCNAARRELETQIVIAEADTVSFSGLPQDEAHRLLADLLELTVEGLTRPLHFFPKSAWAYLEESSPDAGLKKARGVWFGSEYTESAPESEQLVYRLAFRGHDDPLDEEFIRLSERILRPMHEALKVKR